VPTLGGPDVLERLVLFVAREPDETLRTYLPVLAELQRRGRRCLVLFHHQVGNWASQQLEELGTPIRTVELPARPAWTRRGPAGRLGPALGELWQLWQAKRLAARLIHELNPAAVVVIQDTILLERFLVREANRRALGTLVVQWAFTFPQSMYDLLGAIKKG
jgi:hypothetical protein